MAILKRATAALRKAGIEHLTIESRLWGTVISDPRLKAQRSTVYRTRHEALAAALAGERPILISLHGKETMR